MLTPAASYSRTPPPHVVGPRRREETLAARAKCALHGGREFLVHLLKLETPAYGARRGHDI